MAKYLIMSDTHGDKEIIKEVKNKYQEQVDLIFHCGDSELNVDDSALEDIQIVQGNCDFAPFNQDIVIENNNNRIFMTHGHLYSVNYDLLKLKYKAKETAANIVLFGHTHVPTVEFEDGILLINPGSLLLPRIYPKVPTYVVLDVDDQQYAINYYNRDHKVQEIFSKVIKK